MKRKTVYRILRYDGPEEWVDGTMKYNAVQGGILLNPKGGPASIKELKFGCCSQAFMDFIETLFNLCPTTRVGDTNFKEVDK